MGKKFGLLSDKIPESHLQACVKKSLNHGLNRTYSFHYFVIEEDYYSENYTEVVIFDGA